MDLKRARLWFVCLFSIFIAISSSVAVRPALAAGQGSISGTVTDPSNGVVAGAMLTLKNVALATEYKTVTDAKGYYVFPNVPVGSYNLTVEATGFQSQQKSGITVDSDSALSIDTTLAVAGAQQSVTVEAQAEVLQTQPETVATQLGEVVSDKTIATLPLNGRSYTDLLAIQPGVSPVTTLTSTSVIMSGVTGTINPSGDLNPGDVSINGQRESSNGFMVNGTDVREHMNGGTSVIPNLDSIAEFRVLTNNFDPEYGNYNGGMINVTTKSGSGSFHGTGFEFLRNTSLDARNYFDADRGVFQQNQFGGTIGGPILKQRLFFFADYQGTRTSEGVTSPVTPVPSLADRSGNLTDQQDQLTGVVSGPFLANLLSQEFGYPVTQGEPYFFPGCTSVTCVLPGAQIPQRVWAAPSKNLLQYIPTPNLPGNLFSTSSFFETVRDDKLSGRIDANTGWGQMAGYYFFDNYRLDNPYPGGQGGADIPGFDALTIGRSQEVSFGDTKILGVATVNELHLGYLRNANIIGEPHGGLGVTFASQGFVTGAGTPGITVQAPQYEGVTNIVFPSFIMGVPITNTNQWNNTMFLNDSVSKVIGSHTFKFGGEFHADQVNESPNATFNGTFNILGTETGDAFADYLLGVPSQFTQSTGQHFYLRDRYASAFAEDSWKPRSDLTVNYGVRWEMIMPWWEKYNNIQTYVQGAQSALYPNAIPGMVVPGDPGIPSTLSPTKYKNFAPRVGIAYAPHVDRGILKYLLGSGGDSSIRASFGIFYTNFPGLTAGVMYSVPPFGYNYLSPAPPLFTTPFINAGDGTDNGNPYPLAFPPNTVSAKNPYTAFNWDAVNPISADPFFYYKNSVPYTENVMVSFQRRIVTNMLLTLSYVGNQGHHELVEDSANPGNAALCLSLSKLSQVAPGSSTCGPYGEDGTYTSAAGQTFIGTRNLPWGQGSNYGENTAQITIGNSHYNAFETSVRYTGKRSTFLFSYTYSHSMDQASNVGEQINPFNPRLSWALSSWDMTHNFVATYRYQLPFDQIFHRNRLTEGWSISGTTRFASGFPVTLFDDSDNSLLGTLGNGVNNELLDTPQYSGAPLNINNNPRTSVEDFNTAAFSVESLGQLGNSPRRFFHGPGLNNFDLEITKTLTLTEAKSLDFRVEAFNVFNHAQFYGPSAVDGLVNDSNFGQIVSAAAPRLLQAAIKFYF